MTVHPDWNQGRAVKDGNDIALIRLPRAATTIEQDPKVRVLPACVRWNRDISVASQNDHFVVGWGRTNNDEADLGNQTTVGAFSTILQKLQVPVFSAQFCIKQYPLFRQIHKERHLCAGGEKGKFGQFLSLFPLSNTQPGFQVECTIYTVSTFQPGMLVGFERWCFI